MTLQDKCKLRQLQLSNDELKLILRWQDDLDGEILDLSESEKLDEKIRKHLEALK